MPRVKRGTKRRARRKKYLKRTKGFFLTKSKLYQSAQEAANRADRYAKRDRRVKKRQYRRLWIQRVGAAARLNGITYGQLIHGLKAAGISVDRKVLADIAVKDAAGFAQLAEKARAAAPPPKKAAKSKIVFIPRRCERSPRGDESVFSFGRVSPSSRTKPVVFFVGARIHRRLSNDIRCRSFSRTRSRA